MFTWPDWFPLQQPGERVETKRWRGLAVLSTRLSYGGIQDSLDPVSGDRFTDRDVALHTIIKPMKYAYLTNAASGADLIAPKPGVQILLHTIVFSIQQIAADTGSVCSLRFITNGVTQYLRIGTVTTTAGQINLAVPQLAVLCDANTPITVVLTGVYTSYHISASYQEVGGAP